MNLEADMLVRLIFWLRDKCDSYLLRHVPDIDCPKCGSECNYHSNRCSQYGCGRVTTLRR